MRKFVLSAAAMTFAALLVSAPASADFNGGGPNKQGSQCWKDQVGAGKDGRWGMWGACPQAASVAATPRRARRAAR